MYLKGNNPLYSDVSVDIGNIPDNLLSYHIPEPRGTAEDSKEIENLLEVHRFNYQETLFVPSLLTGEEISVAAGEGKQPISILSDTFSEQIAFSCLYPQVQFGYNIERNVKQNRKKYFHQQLLASVRL